MRALVYHGPGLKAWKTFRSTEYVRVPFADTSTYPVPEGASR